MKTKIIAAALIMLPATAFADFSVDSLAKICNQEALQLSNCDAIESSTQVVFTAGQMRKVSKRIDDSTGSWGDSIFEGEVDSNFAAFKYTARKMQMRSDSSLLGYLVRFSYKGWETSCQGDDYDRAKPETYRKCEKGRIYQTIVISADLQQYDILREAALILPKKD